MPSAQARKIEAIRVGEKGQIAVPPKYCKLHKLSKGSEVLLIQLGETLMVVPKDTLSALASTFGGIVRPICLAVLRIHDQLELRRLFGGA